MEKHTAQRVFITLGLVIAAVFLVLVSLKLGGLLPWSWWWVSAPLWMPFAAVVMLAGIFGIMIITLASATSPWKKGGSDDTK